MIRMEKNRGEVKLNKKDVEKKTFEVVQEETRKANWTSYLGLRRID